MAARYEIEALIVSCAVRMYNVRLKVTVLSDQRHWQLKPEAPAARTRGTRFTSQELPSFLVISYRHRVFANLLLSCHHSNYLVHNYVTYLSPLLHAGQSFSHIGISLSNSDSGRDTRGTLST